MTRRAVIAALTDARRGLRLRRRRSLLTALGIALAAAMLSAAVVISDGLGRGFDRAARAADLPDVIVRFDPEPIGLVGQRIRALPDLAGYATRTEQTNVGIAAGPGRGRGDAVAEVVAAGARRGYAVVAGRDLPADGSGVLVEQAFAAAWHLRVGSELDVDGLGPERVDGLVQAPDNVGYPLAKPRFYVSRAAVDRRFAVAHPSVNYAEIWLRDPGRLNEVLVQARASAFGLHNLRFATRSGVRVLLDQAAGIVIDLLVALSLIALATAGAMLASSARAEVQRRLATIGVERAVGATAGHVALAHAVEAALVAAPAAAVGSAAGLLATYGPASRLLALLNEPPPGAGVLWPVAGGWLVGVAIAVGGAAWPAWRAARRPLVGLLRGGDVTSRGSGAHRARRGGLLALGARLVRARRARLVATVITLGLSSAFVLLMLSLASELSSLETDPGALGERYALTAGLPAAAAPRVRAIAGVQAAAPRYEIEAVDSFSLGETIDVIAYPGDHTVFEAPQLVAGHRLRGGGQAEVGQGLAQALGLQPGQTIALGLSSGRELRLRVAGVVSSLDHDGRVAYVPAAALLRADPSAPSQIVIRLTAGRRRRTRLRRAAGARRRAGHRGRRHLARSPPGGGAAHDPARRGRRRRSRVSLRPDPGVRADRAGTAPDGRRPARLRGGRGGGRPAPARGRTRPRRAGGDPRRAARALPARAGAVEPSRVVRHPAPPRRRARAGADHPGAAGGRRRGRRLGGPSGQSRVGAGRAGIVSGLTRRDALRIAAALALAGCQSGTSPGSLAGSGSTRERTWVDPHGDGQLRVGPGEPMVARTELGPAARFTATLTTIAHVTDAHVLDASSPARVSFLDRLGAPFQSTFRPQETLTAQVLAGAARAVRALGPALVLQGGDLIDNDQSNELTHALAALRGGAVAPGSGRDGYFGVQSGLDTDPFYYRPDVDAPRHPGLLRRAVAPFAGRGAGAPIYPVLGDHDALVAGAIAPTPLTRSLAVGDRALWDLPRGLTLPPGARSTGLLSPDGPPDPGLVDDLLRRALAGATVRVPPDPDRRELTFAEVLGGLRAVAGPGVSTRDAGPA